MELKLPKLNLPRFDFKFKSDENIAKIYDEIRKDYFIITPEEWVRQNFVKHLIQNFSYPIGRIAVEKQIKVNNNLKRFDVLVYDKKLHPLLLVECKAPEVLINQTAFSQAGVYNIQLRAKYIIVTNGMNHYAAEIDFKNKKYTFLKELPNYNDIC